MIYFIKIVIKDNGDNFIKKISNQTIYCSFMNLGCIFYKVYMSELLEDSSRHACMEDFQ